VNKLVEIQLELSSSVRWKGC